MANDPYDNAATDREMLARHEHQSRHDPQARREPGCPQCAAWKHPQDQMPLANDAAGMRRWHHEHGLPWGTVFDGPDPLVVRRMVPAGTSQLSLSVHLANEHGIDDRKAVHGAEVEHMHAHLVARFRSGQEHYHGEQAS